MKYIFITGGVVSGLGKGVLTSSIGALLRARDHKVTAIKIDPYINLDAGTMRPYEHGEVFVTQDGAETDLDLGNYERFLDIELNRQHNITTGQVYLSVIQKERKGEYLSHTVQVVPHVTDEIKARLRQTAKAAGAEICVIEVGGTVGDIESLPFLEAIRTMRFEEGRNNVLYIHLTLAPELSSGEIKTKPTQHSVAMLRSVGISPDLIVVRSKTELSSEIKKKIALFSSVEAEDVFSSHDLSHIYELPLSFEDQNLGRVIENRLHLGKIQPNLWFWQEAVKKINNPIHKTRIAFVGKYVAMSDAYLSIIEALGHAGIANSTHVEIKWVDAEELENTDSLQEFDGILVGPGFGLRGIEGKIRAARFARENKTPYLGICLGMQIAVIEWARHVAGLEGANSTEFDPYTPYPVIDLMPEQLEIDGLGGTMRLGNWPMEVLNKTKLATIYGTGQHFERHRHRFEVNPKYLQQLTDSGLIVSALTPGMAGRGAGLVEAIELDHPFFIGLQSHPEFRSRPMRPSPPFKAFIAATIKQRS